ncbi:MAG: DciA family protein [Victivallales bacterium]|nr:DciA family protein [Victivallales bacterium]
MATSRDKRRFHHKIYRAVLKDWYGSERGQAEMAHYCPDSIQIDQLIDGVMKRAVPKEIRLFQAVKAHWDIVAGKQLSRISEPVAMHDGVVEVAVSHPAWIREMQGPVKKMLITNINRELGSKLCIDLKYIPAGR